jgi:hypothetical protein
MLEGNLFSHCMFLDCWQLATRPLTRQTCYKLFQQLVIVLRFNNLITSCEWQPCSNLIKWQHCYNMLASLLRACCEHILLTSCELFMWVCGGLIYHVRQVVQILIKCVSLCCLRQAHSVEKWRYLPDTSFLFCLTCFHFPCVIHFPFAWRVFISHLISLLRCLTKISVICTKTFKKELLLKIT